jgi:hypothetical protein
MMPGGKRILLIPCTTTSPGTKYRFGCTISAAEGSICAAVDA